MSIRYFKFEGDRPVELEYEQPGDKLKAEWPSAVLKKKPKFTRKLFTKERQNVSQYIDSSYESSNHF